MNWIRKTLLLTCFIIVGFSSFAQIDTEFWFAAPDVTSSNNKDRPIVLRISSFKEPAVITISQPAGGGLASQIINLGPNSSAKVDLTNWIDQVECKPGNVVQNKGIRIISTAQISAYYEVNNVNNVGLNPEMFILKGKNALGNDFFISSQNFGNNGGGTPTPYSSFNIVASEDNTTVTITPSKDLVGHVAGLPFTITLNRGQTYAAIAASQTATQHLEGSKVSSTKPIAITLADDFISSPGFGCADLIGDQTIPLNIIGTEYIATKGYLLGSLEKIYVTATANSTTVSQDGTVVTTLNAGQSFQINLTNASTYIQASKPVYAYQVSGIGCEVGSAILPPIKCTGSLAATFAKSTNREIYMNVIVRSGGESFFKVNNNNSIITANKFSPVPGTSNQWLSASVLLSNSFSPLDSPVTVTNSRTFFHVGVLMGNEREGTGYGFFSSFNNNYANASTTTPFICGGGGVSLFADTLLTATYQWTGPNGFTSSQQNPVINNASVASAGKYYLTVSLPGCGNQLDSVTIGIGGSKTSTVNQIICAGDTFEGYTSTGTYIDTLRTSLGCDSIRTLNLTVKPRSFTNLTQTICEGDVFFGYTQTGLYSDTLAAANGCDSIRTINLTVLLRSRSTLVETICQGQTYLGYSTAGTHIDTLIAANGCDSIRTLILNVDTQPLPNLGPNRELCVGDTIQLYPGVYTSYLWQDNSINDRFTVKQSGTYSVTVTNACGNASDNVTIKAVDCVILFPNAFTPNGDGRNDYFKILNAFNLTDYTLTIYNRWGQLVYSTSDFTQGWNGQVKGLPQDPGTFVYFSSYKKDNIPVTTKGTFILIR